MKHSRKAAAAALVWLATAAPAAAAPTVQEFDIPTAMSQPQDLALGPDGNIWFAERGANKIGRISAGNPGDIDEFPTVGTGPEILTVGPDGALWFTEQSSNSIGRIAPGASPTAVSFAGLGIQQPRGIAVGPDGNLWVADADAAAPEVVIVSPAGTAVDQVFLPAGFNARNIARGPDDNMWVAGFSSSAIARITTSGEPTLDPPAGYPVPGGVTPMDLIAGRDGNLWYTAQGTTVGRMTTAGSATNFTSKGVDPFGITIGPDGAVWFAEFQADAVGRVDSAGNTTHVTGLTTGAGPRYVTGGPGDTLWFTEDNGNRVGRVRGIELPQTNPPPPAADTTKPNVTRLRLSRRTFRLGGRGTLIRWRQSEAGRVALRFERRARGKWRRVRRGIAFQKAAGAHRRRFRGRLSRRRALRPGRYRMTLRVRDAAGNLSTPDRVRFKLLRRQRR